MFAKLLVVVVFPVASSDVLGVSHLFKVGRRCTTCDATEVVKLWKQAQISNGPSIEHCIHDAVNVVAPRSDLLVGDPAISVTIFTHCPQ